MVGALANRKNGNLQREKNFINKTTLSQQTGSTQVRTACRTRQTNKRTTPLVVRRMEIPAGAEDDAGRALRLASRRRRL